MDLIANFGTANWIMAALSVLLGAIAWRQTYRLREDKQLVYCVEGVRLYRHRETDLSTKVALRVGNSSLERGYYFVILIENLGTRAIEPKDFNSEGLTITLASPRAGQSDKISFIELASADDASETFELTTKNDTIHVTFDHISPDSAFALHGICTTPLHQLVVKGKLKSFGPVRKRYLNLNTKSIFASFATTIFFAALLLSGLPALLEYRDTLDTPGMQLMIMLPMVIIPLLAMHIGMSFFTKTYKKIALSRSGAARAFYLEKSEKLES
ncbi:hypothetical protein [Roseibium album]|uniref:hypothetical protein n=1 Tax=Roseibium album TaxID=311410 RepID=UPI003297DC50